MTRAKYLSSGSGRQPEEISDVLGKIIESVAVGVDTRHGELVETWAEFVPDDWRSGSPVGVKNGVLLVDVPDGATASLLRYQESALLRSIAKHFDDGLVTSVKLRVRR